MDGGRTGRDMAMHVQSRRRRRDTIEAEFPGALIIDVTSQGPQPWVRLSPFFPHGDIPVPLSPGAVGQSVEGIWQALKVFASSDVDPSKLLVTSMKGLKRTVRGNGPVLGHRNGLHGSDLMGYEQARRAIYLPAYQWVLTGPAADVVTALTETARDRDVVLLDYTTNGDVSNLRTPLSHAALIVAHIDGTWPAAA
jgi:hypothetical protein